MADSTTGLWEAVQPAQMLTGTRCSRARCSRRPVARLNQGTHRLGGRADAWWHYYCAEHLADYGRVVHDRRVVLRRSLEGGSP